MSELAQRLKDRVNVFSQEIGERNYLHPENLDKAAAYLDDSFRKAGYKPEYINYAVDGKFYRNLEANVLAFEPTSPIILVGAHYDTAPGTPGADDNASSLAVLLELAEQFAGKSVKKQLRFVAFCTEEPPFFRTRRMGSAIYARTARARGERIEAMICLEMLGYFSEKKGSQHYPPLLGCFYPSKGDFIALVSDLKSRKLLKTIESLFKSQCKIPVESASLPRFVPGIDFSDHMNFWKEGYPAVMMTDTAFYRNPYYHTPTDTPEKLDYERMAELTIGLAGTLRQMAEMTEKQP